MDPSRVVNPVHSDTSRTDEESRPGHSTADCTTTIRCVIWGDMEFDEDLMQIIRCPEVQRLRKITQLGLVYPLYPGATHTRYEHSLGSAYLCQKMLKTLDRNSRFELDPFYKKCVILASLLHDVGHGPFSYAWKRMKGTLDFIERSIFLVDDILRKRVPNFFPTNQLEKGILIVQAIIGGNPAQLDAQYKYLTEIVNNIHCEVDVKLCDFLLRDMYYLGKVDEVPEVTKKMLSFIYRARIVTSGVRACHIAYDIEDEDSIRTCFEARAQLRNFVYKHPDIMACRQKFRDLLEKAEDLGFKVNGKNVKGCGKDIQHLNDSVMEHFENFIANKNHVTLHLPDLHKEYLALKNKKMKLSIDDHNIVASSYEFYSLLEKAEDLGFTVNRKKLAGLEVQIQNLDDFLMNELEYFLDDNSSVCSALQDLSHEYSTFQKEYSQLTSYSSNNVVLVKKRRKLKRVLFFKNDGENLKEVEFKY